MITFLKLIVLITCYEVIYSELKSRVTPTDVLLEITKSSTKTQEQNRSMKETETKSKTDQSTTSKFAIYVITSRFSDYKRLDELMELWGNSIQQHSATQEFNFIEIENPELVGKYPSLYLPESYKAYDQILASREKRCGFSTDLVKKSGYIMRHCIENTTADWCFRLMDDTFVNIDVYDEFVTWLNSLSDPRQTVMAYGNCVAWGKDSFYLQGGSGYIFSRRAAEKFLEIEKEWIESLNEPEDNHIMEFFKYVGLKSTDVASTFFSGHFLRRSDYQNFEWNPSQNPAYPVCPNKLPEQSECNSTLSPYSQTVFSHSWGDKLSHRDWKRWFKNVPSDAMVYYYKTDFHVCQAEKPSN